MAMSNYFQSLRQQVGTTLLEVPTVGVLTFDDRGRVLLVRHVEGNVWVVPGGMIEPSETPANAAVREIWEETGLFVDLTHIIGVFGGESCVNTYANGDSLAWVATVFGARPVRGDLTPDGEETLDVRYFAPDELATVPLGPHVRLFLQAAYSWTQRAYFQPATWHPVIPLPAT